MNRKIITILFFLCVGTYSYSQSTVEKKALDFKSVIHSIDTLALLTPIVDIKSFDIENHFHNDTMASESLSVATAKVVKNLLKNKYSLMSISGNYNANRNVVKTINDVLSKINKSENLSPNIELPDSMFNSDNNTSRYCLTNIINGYYPTKEKKWQITQKALPEMFIVSLLSLGTVMVMPNVQPIVLLRIILYDRVDRRVLYYKETNLCDNNHTISLPKVYYDELNPIVVTKYKSLYYK
jgi:hypothetical protein